MRCTRRWRWTIDDRRYRRIVHRPSSIAMFTNHIGLLYALYPYGNALDRYNLYLIAGLDGLDIGDGTPDLAIHPYRPLWCEIGDRHADTPDQGFDPGEHRSRAIAHRCHETKRRQG